MKRREFIGKSLAASMAFSSLAAVAGSSNSQHLVATPQDRARYLARMLDTLCTQFGPRFAGSQDYDRAAELIREQLDLAVPETELDWFSFEGWRLLEEPIFYCGGHALECYAAFGSQAPPEGGARGLLVRLEGDTPFAIVDASSRQVLAHVKISTYGRAVTGVIDLAGAGPQIPTICIGRQDVVYLEAAVVDNAPAHLHFKAESVPNTRTSNIIGTLPGQTDEEIVVFAHADTQYNTQGANDNTASLIIVLMLAHALSGTRPKRTVTFMGTGAEEYNLFGARHFVERRAAAGTLDRIKFCVNFDSLTYGLNLYVHSNDEQLVGIMASIQDDLQLHNTFDPAYPIAFEYPGAVRSEAQFFSDAGVRTTDLNSRGYDEQQLPLWHRPEDTPATVPLDCAENGFLVFNEYLRRLQAL